MAFGFREIGDERFDENRTFALTNKGRGSCTDRFGTRHLHCPEEEFGKLDDDPLQDTVVIQQLDD